MNIILPFFLVLPHEKNYMVILTILAFFGQTLPYISDYSKI